MRQLFIALVLLPLNLLYSQSNSNEPFPSSTIGPNLYKIEVDGNSIIASIGPDGVLLTDVGGESKGRRVMATVRKLGGTKIDYIIDTHWHVDHTGGNICFGKTALIIAHENVRKRLSEDKCLKFWNEEHLAFPEYALPDIVFSDRMTLYVNGEEIEIIHLPSGHTDGDVIVYFTQANVLHVGDCLFSNGFPAIDFEMGGSVEGFAENLNTIASTMPPDVRIIAGHGPDYTVAQLKSYEKMIRSSLKAVREAMQKDMSLEAMQPANLLEGWEAYSHGFFSCDQWINMIYQSLLHHSHRVSTETAPGPQLKAPYLGQTPPGITPKVFAPGLISTDLDEFGCTFSPDGSEFYFTRTFTEPRRHTIMVCRCENEVWSKPEIASFSGVHSEAEPNFSTDGKKLFFGRLRQTEDGDMVSDIMLTECTGASWSAPCRVVTGMFATVAKSGTLYFTDVSNKQDKGDIVSSRLIDGVYAAPEKLTGGVNSPYLDAHPFIAPDESYLIFDSDRPGGAGSSDLYVVFRMKNGTWGKAINLGSKINTPGYNAIPSVSPDGKYLFYHTDGDIWWVDAGVIETLK